MHTLLNKYKVLTLLNVTKTNVTKQKHKILLSFRLLYNLLCEYCDVFAQWMLFSPPQEEASLI